MIKKEFFDTYHGHQIYKYTIVGGITVSVVTLGARITNIFAPDKNGSLVDVALSMTSAEDIVEKGDYMGATIGRCGNRIGGDGFALNGKTYSIWRNGSAAHFPSLTKAKTSSRWATSAPTAKRVIPANSI